MKRGIRNRFRGRAGVSAIALAGAVLVACGGQSAEDHAVKAERAIADERYREAVVHLRNAVQEDRQNAELRLQLGRVALKLRDGETASKELERARSYGVQGSDVDADLARAWLMLGEADNVLDVTGDDPETGLLTALRGRALLMQGEIEAGEAALQRSLTMEETATAHVGLAMLAQSRQEEGAVLDHARTALDLDPADQEAARIKAERLHAAGETERALEILDAADSNNRAGRDLTNQALRASILLDTGELEAADEALSRLRRNAGRAPITQLLDGRYHLARSDFESAKGSAETLLGQSPNHVGGLYIAAVANAQLGNMNSARQQANRLVSLQPGNEQAQQLRDEIVRAAASGRDGSRQLASLEDPDAALDPAGAEDPEAALEQGGQQMPELDDASRELVQGAREALIALREERYEDALAKAEELGEKFPDNAGGPNLAGLAYRAMGRNDDAIAAFEEAVAREPENVSAVTNLSEAYRQGEDLDAATRVLDEALERLPEDVQLLIARARIALADGDTAGSEAHLKRAIPLETDSINASLALARLYLVTDRPQQALDVTEPLLDEHSNSAHLLEAAALAYSRTGDPGAAGELFATLADRTGGVRVRLLAAENFKNAGESDAAVEQYRALLADRPDHLETRMLLAQELLAQGNLDAAKPEIDRVAEQSPDAAQTSSLLARYHFMREDFDSAIQHFQDTLDRAPQTNTAIDLARAQWATDRREAARDTLSDWVDEHEEDDRARMQLAEYMIQLGDNEGARTHYESLLERHPDNAIVHNNLANALLELGEVEAASGHAERAVELASELPAIRDTLGEVRLAQGHAEEAAEHFATAAAADPDNATYRLNQARALAEAGDIDAAQELLDAIIAEAGETDMAERARELRDRL